MKNRFKYLMFFLINCLMILSFNSCVDKEQILFQKDQNYSKFIQEHEKELNKFHYTYRIRPFDRIEIGIFNGTKLIQRLSYKDMKVYADGTLNIVGFGYIKVVGFTEKELALKIQNMYKKYFKYPYVKLEVRRKKAYVLGAVTHQKSVEIKKDYITLVDALAQCEGFTEDARKDNILIISGNLNHPQVRKVDLTKLSSVNVKNLIVKPHDIIYVQPKSKPPINLNNTYLVSKIINLMLSSVLAVKELSE